MYENETQKLRDFICSTKECTNLAKISYAPNKCAVSEFLSLSRVQPFLTLVRYQSTGGMINGNFNPIVKAGIQRAYYKEKCKSQNQ